MSRRSSAHPRIGLDVVTPRTQKRLQSIFTEHRLVATPREAPGTFSAVFVEVIDDKSIPALRHWIRRDVPAIIVSARAHEVAFRYACSLGAADGLLLPLETIQTRLALQHVLSKAVHDRNALPTLNLAHLERMAIDEALRRTGRSFSDAAELLGVGRSTLYRRVPELFPEEG